MLRLGVAVCSGSEVRKCGMPVVAAVPLPPGKPSARNLERSTFDAPAAPQTLGGAFCSRLASKNAQQAERARHEEGSSPRQGPFLTATKPVAAVGADRGQRSQQSGGSCPEHGARVPFTRAPSLAPARPIGPLGRPPAAAMDFGWPAPPPAAGGACSDLNLLQEGLLIDLDDKTLQVGRPRTCGAANGPPLPTPPPPPPAGNYNRAAKLPLGPASDASRPHPAALAFPYRSA